MTAGMIGSHQQEWLGVPTLQPSQLLLLLSMQALGSNMYSTNSVMSPAQPTSPPSGLFDMPVSFTSDTLFPPTSHPQSGDAISWKDRNTTTLSMNDDKADQLKKDDSILRSTSSSTKRKAECDLQPPPVRALTAYNYFFRFERDRLLQLCDKSGKCQSLDSLLLDGDVQPECHAHHHMTPENSADFQERLLHDQWSRDPTVKRKHCKSHGKISFQSLVTRISQGWKDLPECLSSHCQEGLGPLLARHGQAWLDKG